MKCIAIPVNISGNLSKLAWDKPQIFRREAENYQKMCVYTTYFPQLVSKSCSKGSVRRWQMLTERPEPFCQLLWLVLREIITTVTRVEEALRGDENIH